MIDIEKLKYLPKKESMRKGSHHGWWCNWRSASHRVKGKYPHVWAKYTLEKFIGKNVNKAFSYFCDIVPKYMQQEFWDELDYNEECMRKDRRNKYRQRYFFVNKQHRIQTTGWPRRDKDYFYENHRIRKIVIQPMYPNRPHPKYGIKLKEVATVKEIVEYDAKYYEGTKGYYRALYQERMQYRRRNKAWRDEYKNKEYDLQRLKREKKANEEDELIRDRHGFDENSFKGIEYHGGKRKRAKRKNKKNDVD